MLLYGFKMYHNQKLVPLMPVLSQHPSLLTAIFQMYLLETHFLRMHLFLQFLLLMSVRKQHSSPIYLVVVHAFNIVKYMYYECICDSISFINTSITTAYKTNLSCTTACCQNVSLVNRCITNTSMNSMSSTNVSFMTAPISTLSCSTACF